MAGIEASARHCPVNRTRMLDESRDLREMLELIYRLYEEEKISYTARIERAP